LPISCSRASFNHPFEKRGCAKTLLVSGDGSV
jgi:hypothetical protein